MWRTFSIPGAPLQNSSNFDGVRLQIFLICLVEIVYHLIICVRQVLHWNSAFPKLRISWFLGGFLTISGVRIFSIFNLRYCIAVVLLKEVFQGIISPGFTLVFSFVFLDYISQVYLSNVFLNPRCCIAVVLLKEVLQGIILIGFTLVLICISQLYFSFLFLNCILKCYSCKMCF